MRASVETIKVIIRFKGNEPLTDDEKALWRDNGANEIIAPSLTTKMTNNDEVNGGVYTFDKILIDCSQEEMYAHTAKDTVKEFTKGYNGTIFAYG